MTAPAPAKRGVTAEHVLMNLGFIVLVSAIVWGVLSRYVTESPATWVEEVSSIAFAWTVFIGAAEVHRRGKHVSVDLLTAFLPPRLREAVAVAALMFATGYCAYVAWLGVLQTVASNSASTSMLRIPLSVPYTGLTLGFLMMAVRSVQRLIVQFRQR
jgi:TRAP-type transport system small permease protein